MCVQFGSRRARWSEGERFVKAERKRVGMPWRGGIFEGFVEAGGLQGGNVKMWMTEMERLDCNEVDWTGVRRINK